MNNEKLASELTNAQAIIKSDTYSILNNGIRFQIIANLLIFNELSMSDLSRKLIKSKSTLHRHIKSLTDLGLVELSKEKKVRGSIKAKYYKLTDGFLHLLHKKEKRLSIKEESRNKQDNGMQDYINLIKLSIILNKKPLDILKNILEFYSENSALNYSFFQRELQKINPVFNIMFLTEPEFKKLNEKLKELNLFLKEIENTKKKNKSQNEFSPYFFASFSLNLIELFNIEQKL